MSAPLRFSLATIRKFVGGEARLDKTPTAGNRAIAPCRGRRGHAPEVAQWKQSVAACVPAIRRMRPVMGVKAGKIAYRNMTGRWGRLPALDRPHLHQRALGLLPGVLGIRGRPELCHLLSAAIALAPRAYGFMPDWKSAAQAALTSGFSTAN